MAEEDEQEAGLQREIRQGRKFTPQEAMARMAGPGAMKGASPIPRQKQAEMEVAAWLKRHVADPAGALHLVLHRHVAGSAALAAAPDRPLVALEKACRGILQSKELLKDVVRQADAEWGRAMEERPFFDKEGSPPHRDDPYTLETVGVLLHDALRQLCEP